MIIALKNRDGASLRYSVINGPAKRYARYTKYDKVIEEQGRCMQGTPSMTR